MKPTNPTRIAIYARYSSDLQNPSSVDDQIALCRRLIREQFPSPTEETVFRDAAISGATLERPGIRGLLKAVDRGLVDVVVAEGLDRLSRSLKDTSSIFETLGYHGVTIWTAHEGRITELHVGLKGTMNALFLKDMKDKVRRGQSARVAAGYAASSSPYGYDVVRGVVDEKGRNVNGVRRINETEAAVVRRIFREYADGRLLPEIIEGLNGDRIPAPGGGVWKRTALAGSPKKAEGVLRNESYLGDLVYNRSRIVRNPITGKSRYVTNPPEEWTRTHVPELRIIDDELWRKVQALLNRRRAEAVIRVAPRKPPEERVLNSHNQHALTGWVTCGVCGGMKSLGNEGRYICSNSRYAKTCSNARGTLEPVLLAAVFRVARDRVRHGPDFRPAFGVAFARDLREASERREKAEAIRTRIDNLMEAVELGVDREHTAKRVLRLQEDLARLRERSADASVAELPDEAAIRKKLLSALAGLERTRDVERRRLAFRHILSEIVLTPVVGSRRGETVEIKLGDDWSGFWRLISS